MPCQPVPSFDPQNRAIAVAALGNSDLLEPVLVTNENRFQMLANGTVDVMVLPNTHTMGRDVYEQGTRVGLAFSSPLFYTGLAFGGHPDFVECAERLGTSFEFSAVLWPCLA